MPKLRAWTPPTFDPDDVFLEAVDAVVQAALERTDDDSDAGFRFFRRLLTVAQEGAGGRYLS